MTISEERKKRVIDLYYNQGKTTREIAKIERMSIRDISSILKEEEARRQKYKGKHRQEEKSSKAYQFFSKGKTTVEVVIELNLRESEAIKYYREYWKLKGLHKLNSIYQATDGKLWTFLKLYKQLIKEKGMSVDQVVNAVDTSIHKLPYIENLYEQVKDQAEKMQHIRQRLENDMEVRKNKISILDKIAFSSEQECKRIQHQVQELTDKKYRLEKLIANILSDDNEGYSKIKQIVKENVKAVLANNKILIPIYFAAVIQTLKADPQMVKLIQNIPSANDGEQYKHDNNNTFKYLESNKATILNLAEKNYENLVEALTNNTIAPTSSYSTLSSSLSSTFPNSFDK